MSGRKAGRPADEAFRAEIAELQRQHHEAWLNREPGDGLAIVEVLDPETNEVVRYDRVQPSFHAFTGSAFPESSKCQGHRCP